MPTDESNMVPAPPSDLASASVASIRIVADAQPLSANVSQSGKCLRRWLDLPEGDIPSRCKQLPEISVHHPEVVADLPIVMHLSGASGAFGAITHSSLYDLFSPRRPSPACVNPSRGVVSDFVISSWIPKLAAPTSSAP